MCLTVVRELLAAGDQRHTRYATRDGTLVNAHTTQCMEARCCDVAESSSSSTGRTLSLPYLLWSM